MSLLNLAGFFILNREGAKDAKGRSFFLIGVADQEKVRPSAEDFFLAFFASLRFSVCMFRISCV